MIPTDYQFERAKWLCSLLRGSGANVLFRTSGNLTEQTPAIRIEKLGKVYHLADPNWDVVNKQLGCLVNIHSMS